MVFDVVLAVEKKLEEVEADLMMLLQARHITTQAEV